MSMERIFDAQDTGVAKGRALEISKGAAAVLMISPCSDKVLILEVLAYQASRISLHKIFRHQKAA